MAEMEQLDDFLGKYVEKYDRWLAAEQVDFRSKVIPVSRSI